MTQAINKWIDKWFGNYKCYTTPKNHDYGIVDYFMYNKTTKKFEGFGTCKGHMVMYREEIQSFQLKGKRITFDEYSKIKENSINDATYYGKRGSLRLYDCGLVSASSFVADEQWDYLHSNYRALLYINSFLEDFKEIPISEFIEIMDSVDRKNVNMNKVEREQKAKWKEEYRKKQSQQPRVIYVHRNTNVVDNLCDSVENFFEGRWF